VIYDYSGEDFFIFGTWGHWLNFPEETLMTLVLLSVQVGLNVCNGRFQDI
jgi:hypothetical protein